MSKLTEIWAEFSEAPSNDIPFQRMIEKGIEGLALNEADLALLCGVGKPTIRRWRDGLTAPHPLVRRIVHEKLFRHAHQLESSL